MSFRFLTAGIVALFLFLFFSAGVVHAQEDVTPPALVDVTFEPAAIDTSFGPVTVTLTIHATDDLSGIDGGQLHFENSAVEKHHIAWIGSDNLASGSDRDGYYVTTITLPRYSAYGVWKMFYFDITDRAGNSGSAEAPPSPYPGTGWQPRYDSILIRNGPMFAQPVIGNRLFLPALSTS